MIFFISIILTLSIRFLDHNGFDIPNISEYVKFDILLEDGDNKFVFKARNHPYLTRIPFYEDACTYSIIQIIQLNKFQKDAWRNYYDFKIRRNLQTQNNSRDYKPGQGFPISNRKDSDYNAKNNLEQFDADFLMEKLANHSINSDENYYNSISNINLGYFNSCDRSLKFILHGIEYSYRNVFGSYHLSTRRKELIDRVTDGKFTLKVFIVNDHERAEDLGSDIKQNTENIMAQVRNIFLESKAKINIKLEGMLNYKNRQQYAYNGIRFIDKLKYKSVADRQEVYVDKVSINQFDSKSNTRNFVNNSATPKNSVETNHITNTESIFVRLNDVVDFTKNNVLEEFRSDIEPMRIEPRNLGTPLSRSDFVILLKKKHMTSSHRVHEGIGYFNGANGLNRSYAVVFADDNNFYTAKKIAHEIGHALGVPHDKGQGFLMAKIDNDEDVAVKRLFSSESLGYIDKFIATNEHIFDDLEFDTTSIVESISEAKRAVNSLRKYSFDQVVEGRLNGIPPETTQVSYYLTVTLVFYTFTICLALYYLK